MLHIGEYLISGLVDPRRHDRRSERSSVTKGAFETFLELLS